ncbi:MAG: SIS domain-containing protein [Acidimicrobiia bacterium]
MGARNRLLVSLPAPSLYGLYQSPPRLDGALVMGISQSGESPDLLAALSEARKQGRPTLSITNPARFTDGGAG